MTDHIEKKCPKCSQRLRLPANLGGMLLACPSCGEKFHSDFKMETASRRKPPTIQARLFGMPYAVILRLCRFFSP